MMSNDEGNCGMTRVLLIVFFVTGCNTNSTSSQIIFAGISQQSKMNTLTFFFTTLLSFFHPFYISMTDINYNDKNHEVEVSIRIFTDDFENTLRKQHSNINIDIEHPANQTQMNGFVNDYIQHHLSFQINGKPAAMGFAGYEIENESIWTYFEIKDVSAVQKVVITNTLLHDYNENQINLIHIKANDKEQETKLNYPDSKAEFSF